MLFSNPFASLLGRKETLLSLPKPGVYHFLLHNEKEKTRAHLRLEENGNGLLLINAARAYHLNPTAAQMAYLVLNQVPDNEIIDFIRQTYRVSSTQSRQDYDHFSRQMAEILHPDGACPVCDLALDILPPFSATPSAPYRMDLAVTYRCNNDCAHCYNARPRSHPELTTRQWLDILDELWDICIPHIVFTGGEPTLREDLPILIRHAETNGQITGINTNGRRLHNRDYLQSLVDAGLDHVQITLESHLPDVHDMLTGAQGAWQQTVTGIRNVLQTRLYMMTNTTLLQQNSLHLADLLDFLSELGVPTIGLNALIYSGKGAQVGTGLPETDLPPLLSLARSNTERTGQRLIWYTPTQYCHFDPVALELGVKGCTAASYTMCMEPDGSVIPCQSYYQSLGNLLVDTWQTIWNHPLAVSLREHRHATEECRLCEFLSECGGGCPLAPFNPNRSPILPKPN